MVITFYSYKGGTGRTMALANVGCLLSNMKEARRGVLMVDWDLEAPSLHQYFAPHMCGYFGSSADRATLLDGHPGIMEIMALVDKNVGDGSRADEDTSTRAFEGIRLDEYVIPTDVTGVHLLKAGSFDDSYSSRVAHFPWEGLFNRAPGVYSSLAQFLARRYDYVLIDSRTGLSDVSSVCTLHLPERLVVVFTPNRLSLTGAVRVVGTAAWARKRSADLRPLVVFPLASRIDISREKLILRWRFGENEIAGYQPIFEELLRKTYGLESCGLNAYFNTVQIPHASDYAFGEEIPTIAAPSPTRQALTDVYQRFTYRLANLDGPWEEPTNETRKLPASTLPKRIRSVRFDRKAAFAISSAADHSITIWNVAKRAKDGAPLIGHLDEVRTLAVSSNGNRLISGSFDGTLKVWDIGAHELLRTIELDGGKIRAVAFLKGTRRAICGSADWALRLLDLGEGKVIATLRGHTDYVNSVVTLGDGKRAASASDDKTIRIWELEGRKEVRVLHGHDDFVMDIATVRAGRLIVSASFDKKLIVWDTQSGLLQRELIGHQAEVRSVAVTRDGRFAASASYDRTIRVWDLRSGKEIKRFKGKSAFAACDITPDGRLIIAGDLQGKIHFYALGP
jgi:cellulose biosynthesis protein BcsQ